MGQPRPRHTGFQQAPLPCQRWGWKLGILDPKLCPCAEPWGAVSLPQ